MFKDSKFAQTYEHYVYATVCGRINHNQSLVMLDNLFTLPYRTSMTDTLYPDLSGDTFHLILC